MDPALRNTPALIAKVDGHWKSITKRFENLTTLIGVSLATKNPSRTVSAGIQYEMQVETAALIHEGEELQLLIRQMQEMWLFGQLDTLGQSEAQRKTDENAKAVGELLGKVLEMRQGGSEEGNGTS